MRLDLIFTLKDFASFPTWAYSQNSTLAAKGLNLKISSDDHKYHPNPYRNSRKLHDEKGYPFLNLKESQWKLTQHDQNFPVQLNYSRTHASRRRKT